MSAYPVTYQFETSPTWLAYTAALSGHETRDPKRPLRYLELGCGRGYSALVHAAAHPAGEFVAIDRDACMIAEAAAWADACGVRNVTFQATTFAQAELRGCFDLIVLHGVYSWVDAATRVDLRALLRDRLAPGGLAYVSYNCLPGWAGELPLRRLLGEFSAGNSVGAAARTLEQMRGFAYFKAHPTAARAVQSWAGRPEGYLAQEYLADTCEALWAVDVIDDMAAEGLDWIASATPRDQHEALLVDEENSHLIAGLGTPRLKTLALDFAVNRSFRRDVFMRGSAWDGVALGDVIIGCPDGDIPESIIMPRGRIRFGTDFVTTLRNLLAKGPIALGRAVSALGEPQAEVARNLLWLIAAGVLLPLSPDSSAEAAVREKLAKMSVRPAS